MVLVAVLSAACVRSDPVPAASPPLAGLVPCDGGPFVAFIGGLREGEDPGSSSAYDVSYVHGLRPDLTVERITPEPGSWRFAVAPDGARLYTGRDDAGARPGPEVQRFTLDPLDPVGAEVAPGSTTALTVSPDGGQVAVADYDSGAWVVRVLDAREGGETGRFGLPSWSSVSGLAWSPDGRSIALSGTRGEGFQPAVGIAPSGGGDVLPVDVQRVDVGSLRWSPDGSRLLLRSGDVVEVDGATGEVVDVLPAGHGLLAGLTYASRDGRLLLALRVVGARHSLELLERVDDRLELRASDDLPSDFLYAGSLTVPACAPPN